ncbi:MAG TPA: hypothetical protein VG100_15885 [Xanthobacteraceae bacterium]|jgi:hypothetical protein|nr:hypothetical protein [Xanthobacteraceae bacterium]
MKLRLSEEALTVALEGWERVWALRRRLVVPRANIVRAEWHAEPVEIDVWLRAGGTSVPGVVKAGTFLGQGMKQFFYIRRPHGWMRGAAANVLVLDLQRTFYGRVVLSCDEADAARVVAWAGGQI